MNYEQIDREQTRIFRQAARERRYRDNLFALYWTLAAAAAVGFIAGFAFHSWVF